MRKGQYFTLEQMLLFTTGVVITVAIYFSLLAANESIREVAEEDQMKEIGKLVSSQMNRAYISTSDIVMNVEIPKKISAESYNIYVESDATGCNLAVKFRDKLVRIPIDMGYQASGMARSSPGMMGVEKKNGIVKIGMFYEL